MWRKDDKGTIFRDAVAAYRRLRSKARRAIKEGDRKGVDLRTVRVRLRDEADNVLFEGTLAEAARLQYGTDGSTKNSSDQSFKPPQVSPTTNDRVSPPSISPDLSLKDVGDGLIQVGKEQFHAIAQATSDICYRVSADWSEMQNFTNNSFVARSIIPRQSWLDLYIPSEEQPIVIAAIQAAIRTKSIFSLEHRVIRTDGSIGWTRSCAVPVLAPDGSIREWLGAADDMTLRRSAQMNIAETRDTDTKQSSMSGARKDVVMDAIMEWTRGQTSAAGETLDQYAIESLSRLVTQRLDEAGLIEAASVDETSARH